MFKKGKEKGKIQSNGRTMKKKGKENERGKQIRKEEGRKRKIEEK